MLHYISHLPELISGLSVSIVYNIQYPYIYIKEHCGHITRRSLLLKSDIHTGYHSHIDLYKFKNGHYNIQPAENAFGWIRGAPFFLYHDIESRGAS